MCQALKLCSMEKQEMFFIPDPFLQVPFIVLVEVSKTSLKECKNAHDPHSITAAKLL